MKEDIIKSPDTERAERVPPGQKLTEKWPALHYGSVPKIDIAEWQFNIFGLVEKERRLSYQEFMALPMVKVYSDIHCVTGWSKLDNLWEGVSSSQIKELVRILPEAKFVMVHSTGGFSTNLSLSDFFQPDPLGHKAQRRNADQRTRLPAAAGGAAALFLEERQVGQRR